MSKLLDTRTRSRLYKQVAYTVCKYRSFINFDGIAEVDVIAMRRLLLNMAVLDMDYNERKRKGKLKWTD